MINRHFIRAWIVGTIAYIAIHFATHKVIFRNFFNEHLFSRTEVEPSKPFVLAMLFIVPLLMTIVYSHWYRGGNPFKEGFACGSVLGLLFVLATSSVFLNYVGVSPILLALDIPLHIFEEGIVGIIIALGYQGANKISLRA